MSEVDQRFLLVELEPNLRDFYTTYNGVFHSLAIVNGVRSVTNLQLITAETLNAILAPAETPEIAAPKRRRRTAA